MRQEVKGNLGYTMTKVSFLLSLSLAPTPHIIQLIAAPNPMSSLDLYLVNVRQCCEYIQAKEAKTPA